MVMKLLPFFPGHSLAEWLALAIWLALGLMLRHDPASPSRLFFNCETSPIMIPFLFGAAVFHLWTDGRDGLVVAPIASSGFRSPSRVSTSAKKSKDEQVERKDEGHIIGIAGFAER
jgi:hypothetical protein